jgi:hypothetical protein
LADLRSAPPSAASSLTWLPLNVIALKHAGGLAMGLIVIGVQASCLS